MVYVVGSLFRFLRDEARALGLEWIPREDLVRRREQDADEALAKVDESLAIELGYAPKQKPRCKCAVCGQGGSCGPF